MMLCEASGPGQKGGAPQGDSQMVALFKNGLTEGYLTTWTLEYADKKNKRERVTKVVQSLVFGHWQININWPASMMSPPRRAS